MYWCVLDTTVDVGVTGKAVCGGVCFYYSAMICITDKAQCVGGV